MNSDLAAGLENLLVTCAGIEAGERVLVVAEDPALGWYDAQAPAAAAEFAEGLGASVTIAPVGAPSNSRDPGLGAAMESHDRVVFFARVGDQDRFAEPVPGRTHVMVYARTAAALASPYGRADHRAMAALKQAVNDILLDAPKLRVTCPLGTDIARDLDGPHREPREDVSVRRFPLGVPQPVDAAAFTGRVALANYLTPTGSKVYDPPSLALDEVAFAEIAQGRIESFSGDSATVGAIREHYDRTAAQLGIEPDFVHSWHAGIHPGCAYPGRAADDPDHWSNTVFTNPRFLHFHTCGAYAPGEICWMVADPTVTVGDVPLWENGRLCPGNFAGTRGVLADWPELAALFAEPSDETGL